MSRTFDLYDAMFDFRKAQITSREIFLQKKKNLERYAGSPAYDEDLKKIREEREKANAEARAKCKARIEPIFQAMHEHNAKRRVSVPSEEDMRLLAAVKMLEKPGKILLDSVANTLNGNALSLAILDDIARAAWGNEKSLMKRWTQNYSSRATNELTVPAAAEAINNLQRNCYSILSGSGANRVREMGAERNHRLHGGEYDPDELPQEPEYTTEQDFYKREGSANYALFAAAVNE